MEEIKQKLEKIIEELFAVKQEVVLTAAPEETGADYATNVAMQLARVVHKAPMVIAEEIRSKLNDVKVEVAAPGFLNFTMGNEYFQKQTENLVARIKNGGNGYRGKMVVTEFSDPNPFKVLHVGHFYTSVVGDSISRLIEWDGGEVRRVNFGGDVGLHVGKTIYALQQKDIDNLTIERIAECYVAGTAAYEDDEKAKEEIVRINKIVYALAELGEEKSQERLALENIAEDFGIATVEVARIADLYWRGRKLSYEYFKDFYAKIGLKFDKFYPESSVVGRGVKEVKDHVGNVYDESEGAIVYHGEKVGLHTRVFINAQGVPTYETKDVGLIFTKFDDYHFDESVVVTGNEQTDYMKVVLASVSEYAPKLVEQTTHLTHGLVKLPGNVKMSSRLGNFLRAVDVLQLVGDQLKAAGDLLSGRATVANFATQNSAAGRHLTKESKLSFDSDSYGSSDSPVRAHRMSNTARLRASNLPCISSQITSSEDLEKNKSHSQQSDLGKEKAITSSDGSEDGNKILLAAIKYAFLKYKMGGDIIFDPAESVATNGNSGVYLLYSAVRAKNILSKTSDENVLTDQVDEKFVRRLCKKLVQYEEILPEAAKEKAPHKICTYLYELAQEFSRFYENVKVAGNTREKELKKLVETYYNVMEHGLNLLGIEVPERM